MAFATFREDEASSVVRRRTADGLSTVKFLDFIRAVASKTDFNRRREACIQY